MICIHERNSKCKIYVVLQKTGRVYAASAITVKMMRCYVVMTECLKCHCPTGFLANFIFTRSQTSSCRTQLLAWTRKFVHALQHINARRILDRYSSCCCCCCFVAVVVVVVVVTIVVVVVVDGVTVTTSKKPKAPLFESDRDSRKRMYALSGGVGLLI